MAKKYSKRAAKASKSLGSALGTSRGEGFVARSLSDLYVFYERLSEDSGAPSILYEYVKGQLGGATSSYNEYSKNTSWLNSLAEQEKKKEISLLNKIFGVNISVDLRDAASVKDLIQTLNACLNLKSVYDRNIKLITSTQGQKSVISFFPFYFTKAWNRRSNSLASKIAKSVPKGQTIISYASPIIEKEIEEATEEAIEAMLSANAETVKMRKEDRSGSTDYASAYAELIGAIGKVKSSGSLARQIYDIYNLDEIKEALLKEITQKTRQQRQKSVRKFSPKSMVYKNFHRDGGLSLEAITDTVLSMIADGFNFSNGNISAKASGYVYKNVGSLGAKADNMISFNIDSSLIEDTLEVNEGVSREKNIAMFNELGRKMSNLKDGFIVYESAKNYSTNKDFKSRGGFSSGTALSVQTLQGILSRVDANMDSLIGSIMQLGAGAIGDKGLKSSIENTLAHYIAYFLFDDFDTIGINGSDGQAIHIMNLNGVLIPLSFMLSLLAQSIEEAIYNPTSIVKVSVMAKEIIYPDRASQRESNEWGEAAWSKQKSEALNTTLVKINFFGNFKNIIGNFLG